MPRRSALSPRTPQLTTRPVPFKAGWREVGGKKIWFRSGWESNYAMYLEWLKKRGQIKDWEHEPRTFWFLSIKRGVRSYLPDFRVTELTGGICWHEIKGRMDPKSKTKLKRMAKYYPEEKVILIDAKQYRAISTMMSKIIPDWE